MIETTINYYTGQDVSHLSTGELILKYHQLNEIRRLEAEEKNGTTNA